MLTEDFIVQDLGVQEEWVYDIEVQDNHNFFANDICVHNSSYFSYEPILIKKFGENYEEVLDNNKIVQVGVKYIDISQKEVEKGVKMLSSTLNAYAPERLTMDAEVITSRFISLLPKMYLAKKYWEDGDILAKPKLKVTGLSVVRSTTPKFFRETIEETMEYLLDGDLDNTKTFMQDVYSRVLSEDITRISTNVGVTSVDYTFDDVKRKYVKWTGTKYLSAPMNSRASIVHNKYIHKMGINTREIVGGDKISYVPLNMPNPTNSDVIAFLNPVVLESLKEYIDYDTIYQKGYDANIKLIADPLNWDLSTNTTIDDEEW